MRAGHVLSRPAGTALAHSFRAGPEGLEYLAYGQRDNNDIVYYPDSGKVVVRRRRRDRAHRAARLLGRGGPPRVLDRCLECGRGRAAPIRCARPRRGVPARRPPPRARSRRRRRRCSPCWPRCARRAHRRRARHARAARARRARSTPGRRSPRSGSRGLPFALAGWRAARRGRALAPAPARLVRRSGQVARDRRRPRRRSRMTGLVAALRAWPHGWWLPVTRGRRSRVELLLTVVAPVLILPLFLRSHPLPPGPLADDLHALAARGGVRVRAAARARGERQDLGRRTRSSPGYGPTRRIMLFDTLLGDEPGRRGAAGRDARGARARARPPRERRPLAPDRGLAPSRRRSRCRGRRRAPAPARGARAPTTPAPSRRCPRCSLCAGARAGRRRRSRSAGLQPPPRARGRRLRRRAGGRRRAVRAGSRAALRDQSRRVAAASPTSMWLGASHPAPYERIARARSRGKENPIPGANGAL